MDAGFLGLLGEQRVIPVVVISDAGRAVELCQALLEGGLSVIEVTFRTAAAADAISAIVEKCPSMTVGAGTLLDAEQVRRAVGCGAKFGLAPGLDKRVIEVAAAEGLCFIPGVATPSEVQRGLALGCRLLKFFPAEQAGGVAYLKALEGPYAHTGVRFIPTGGIHAANAKNYLALDSVLAIGGSWFVDKKFIEAGDWSRISSLTRNAVALAARTTTHKIPK